MSLGSSNSNLGYGSLDPYGGTLNFVNKYSSNNPANFSSNEIPGLPGLSGAKNNIDAAAGIVPDICLFKGGAKKFKNKIKNKIKNITKKYKKMNRRSKVARSIKQRLRHFASRHNNRSIGRTIGRTFAGSKHSNSKKVNKHSRRRQRGGYSQYQNNLPNTPSFSVGGVLSSSQLGLANPPPINVLPNCTNCIDNFNKYTMSGSPSQGH